MSVSTQSSCSLHHVRSCDNTLDPALVQLFARCRVHIGAYNMICCGILVLWGDLGHNARMLQLDAWSWWPTPWSSMSWVQLGLTLMIQVNCPLRNSTKQSYLDGYFLLSVSLCCYRQWVRAQRQCCCVDSHSCSPRCKVCTNRHCVRCRSSVTCLRWAVQWVPSMNLALHQ